MRKTSLAILAALFAVSAFAAPALFSGATESKWSVTSGSKTLGTLTLLTSADAARAEWKASSGGPAAIFLGGSNKVWMRATGGDVELATISAETTESALAPALLLPFTTAAGDAVDQKDGKVRSYSYRGAKAAYTWDAKGPSKIEVTSGGQKYTLTRTSLSASTADKSNFAVRPKKGASGRLAQLAGLGGSSDRTVSATAGSRGVGTKGLKLNDGGDYAALEKVEDRDQEWRQKNFDDELKKFQQTGKVGRERGDN